MASSSSSLSYDKDGFSNEKLCLNALAVSGEEYQTYLNKKDSINGDEKLSPEEKKKLITELAEEITKLSDDRVSQIKMRKDRPHRECREMLKYTTTIENFCRYIQQDLIVSKIKSPENIARLTEIEGVFNTIYTTYEKYAYHDVDTPIEGIISELREILIKYIQY